MPNPPNIPNQTSDSNLQGPVAKSAHLRSKAALAGVLSLFFPGIGQLYNRQPRKGFVLALLSFGLSMATVKTRLLFAFSTMLITIFGSLLWKLFVAAEAGYSAATSKKPESPLPLPWLAYPVLVIAFLVAAIGPSPHNFRSETGFSTFKISSASMCPTLCAGDRVVADSRAYNSKPVQRGDIILLKHASSEALFVKRVIGVAGDTVAPGSEGQVLVNGQPFNPPVPCSPLVQPKMDPADYSRFQRTTLPEGEFFVVGDNLANSYDSRIPEFGAVRQDMVRGKPLYIYWSLAKSRIGCNLR